MNHNWHRNYSMTSLLFLPYIIVRIAYLLRTLDIACIGICAGRGKSDRLSSHRPQARRTVFDVQAAEVCSGFQDQGGAQGPGRRVDLGRAGHGAWDFLTKPLSPDNLRLILGRVLVFRQQRRSSGSKLLSLRNIVGDSPALRSCLDLAAQAAPATSTCCFWAKPAPTATCPRWPPRTCSAPTCSASTA